MVSRHSSFQFLEIALWEFVFWLSKSDGLGQDRFAFGKFTAFHERKTKVIEKFGIVRPEGDHFAHERNGIMGSALSGHNVGHGSQAGVILRKSLTSCGVEFLCMGEVVLIYEKCACFVQDDDQIRFCLGV